MGLMQSRVRGLYVLEWSPVDQKCLARLDRMILSKGKRPNVKVSSSLTGNEPCLMHSRSTVLCFAVGEEEYW